VQATKIVGFVIAGVVAMGGSTVWADSLCPEPAQQTAADAQLKKAEDLERAGKVREANGVAQKLNSECISDYNRHEALLKRTAKALGAEDEKKGNFLGAFEWYQRAQNVADAGRMQRKMVEVKPDDINTVSYAIDYFKHENDAAQEKALRAHALKNVNKALAAEEKSFASVSKNSLAALELAKDWSYYAQAGEDLVRVRAGKRGDTVAAEDGRKFLELALSYYDRAQQPEKAQKVRDKARALARQHESKGDGVVAADYYVIAGDSNKASAVQKETEVRDQKAEDSRKKVFKKDQEDLEKALGF
jgi:tetratricopeptide (TPR) repeat protein